MGVLGKARTKICMQRGERIIIVIGTCSGDIRHHEKQTFSRLKSTTQQTLNDRPGGRRFLCR